MAKQFLANEPLLLELAAQYERSVAQICIRFALQSGVLPLPKSSSRARMLENLDVFDFELTEKEMENIAGMDIGHSEIIDHHCFCTARQLNSVKIHT